MTDGKGPGRPKGSRNKRTLAQHEAIDEGLTPLEYMVSIYTDETKPDRFRLEAAKAAAPYVHARLNSVDLELHRPLGSGEYSGLSEKELMIIAGGGTLCSNEAAHNGHDD